ncbi:hypothetical protein [Desulfobulbus propionicus]
MGGRPWRSLALAGMVVMAACLFPVPSFAGEQADPPAVTTDCRALAVQIEEDNRRLRQELRQVKRELALLNQNLEKPGIREIMAGIGSILGLFGAAALVAGRRRDRKED